MSLIRLFVTALVAFHLPFAADASLRLNKFFVEADPSERPGEVFVTNEGNETLYVQITVEEVINPLSETPETLSSQSPEELGILVSPQRLVLQPGDEKRIRVVALENPNEDRFFKVTVTPVVGDIESNAAIGVKLMIAYGVWVFARPENAEPAISARAEARTLLVENDGGTHGEVRDIEFCPSSTPEACKTIDGYRLLAKNTEEHAFAEPGTATIKTLFRGRTNEIEIDIE